MLTLDDKWGGGVWQMLTLASEGARGGQTNYNSTDKKALKWREKKLFIFYLCLSLGNCDILLHFFETQNPVCRVTRFIFKVDNFSL